MQRSGYFSWININKDRFELFAGEQNVSLDENEPPAVIMRDDHSGLGSEFDDVFTLSRTPLFLNSTSVSGTARYRVRQRSCDVTVWKNVC
jgi:hypothetical protein